MDVYAIYRYMKRILSLLYFVFPFVLVSCSSGWSEQERRLINGAALSRMELVTVDNVEDSLILRKVSRDLTSSQINSVEFGRLVSSMIETVNNPGNEGVGIAAPQVGVNVNLIVVQRFDKEGTPYRVYVNPKIISYGESEILSQEGCLSVPDFSGKVVRSSEIEISYRDPVTFEDISESVSGFTAVIFQHEIDHLTGVLYIDKLSEAVN